MELNSHSSLSAIVLAGGQSVRMGQDKALIAIDETPLLQRVCRVAQRCADPVYVVTPWTERYRDLVGQISLIREVALPGRTLPHGPLVGFAQGLALVESEWVLLLACDLPRLEVPILQAWAKSRFTVEEAVMALLPEHPQGWWEPLCGFYRRRCLSELSAFIEQGGRSFQEWLATQHVQPLSPAHPQMLFNCNTPEDLSQIKPE